MSINLLPWREARYKKRKMHFLLELFVGFLFFLILAYFYTLKNEIVLKNQKREIAHMESKIKEITDSYSAALLLKQKNLLDEKKEKFLQHKEHCNQLLFGLIDDVSKQIFDSIYFTEIKRVEDGIKFSGRSVSHMELAKFLERVKLKIKQQPITTQTSQAQDKSREVIFEVVYEVCGRSAN